MNISFHGADRGVTGSCHLVHCAGKNILIDCGMYQGGHEISEENSKPFGFDPAKIDYVLLTHAHLDHCGRLTLLVKRGFRGEIITTSASLALARVVMMDAAGLQEEEARYQTRKHHRRGDRKIIEPLYAIVDTLNTLDYFGRVAHYNQAIDIAPNIQATFYDAGHILGSASIVLSLNEGDKSRTVAFSGDLGNADRRLLRDPTPLPHVDVVVMETTYGDRLHRSIADSITELYSAINDAVSRGGNVIIPTFALERTQELLFFLREGIAQGQLPHGMQVFLDSPMAISATEIFKRYPESYTPETTALFKHGQDPFNLPGLHFTRETAQSMAINTVVGGAVIMAGSGMCTGGRVRHHLKHNLWRSNSSIIFVGFATQGTLARQIIDGAKKVKIFGEEIAVKAKVYTINGFSAHADRDELLAWHRHIHPMRTFLVHGEEDIMQSFATKLQDTIVEMPVHGQTFEL